MNKLWALWLVVWLSLPAWGQFQLRAEYNDKIGYDTARFDDAKPYWLPARVYTVPELRFRSALVSDLGGSTPLPIDVHRKWRMTRSLLIWWNGRRPDDCWIVFDVYPGAPPGSFHFRCLTEGGPEGFAVFMGYSQTGYPTYQYWFVGDSPPTDF